jgi:diguanylate cyclase (GGDEF)-like protein/PAS domain S-box-containing protein
MAILDEIKSQVLVNIAELFVFTIVYLTIFYLLVIRPLIKLKERVIHLDIENSEVIQLETLDNHRQDEIGELVNTFNHQLSFIHTLFEQKKDALLSTEESFDSLKSLIESLPHLIIVKSINNTVLFVNKAFIREFGYSAEELLGNNLDDVIYTNNASTKKIMADADDEAISSGKSVLLPEVTWQIKNGNYITIEMRKIKIQFRGIPSILTVGVDITERKEHQARIQHMAYHDSLTNLPNRHLFIDRLEQALLRSQRSQKYGALIFVDLDNFKEVNDAKGHFAGDTLLTKIATRLKEVFREEDTVARLGGDEFVVCMTDLGKTVESAKVIAQERAEKLLKSFQNPFIVQGSSLKLGASLGITFFNNHRVSASELLGHADMAMYKAKEAGKNQVKFFEESMAETLARMTQLKEDSRRAIDNHEFYLVYQPQLNAKTNQIIGAEALLRWNHPDKGLISPAEFIPLLEDIELMPEVGELVLKTAIKQTQEWLSEGRISESFKMSVNVSPQQFRMANFPTIVNNIIEQFEVPSSMIDLEITESMIIDNIDYTVAAMKELRSTGVHFSIDDFGTGYSNLNYLKKLPLDVLKVDQSFVRDIQNDPNDTAIVRTILAMARQLNLKTVAEGVETNDQLTLLQEMGCHVYQGYLYSPPLKPADFELLVPMGDLDTEDT